MLETNSQESKPIFKQGVTVSSHDRDFIGAIKAAVDYRGDVSLFLKDGTQVDGFLFNSNENTLELFPKNSPQKKTVHVDQLSSIEFSGRDEAAGKSWEEWVKKREARKAESTRPSA